MDPSPLYESPAIRVRLTTKITIGRFRYMVRTILVARGSLVQSSSPSIVRRRSRRSLPRLHLRQGFLYAAFCLPLSDCRISSARLFRRRRVCEHPHLRARRLPEVAPDQHVGVSRPEARTRTTSPCQCPEPIKNAIAPSWHCPALSVSPQLRPSEAPKSPGCPRIPFRDRNGASERSVLWQSKRDCETGDWDC